MVALNTLEKSNYLSEYFHSATCHVINLTGKVMRCALQTKGHYDILTLTYRTRFKVPQPLLLSLLTQFRFN